jgi:hypothetical protein
VLDLLPAVPAGNKTRRRQAAAIPTLPINKTKVFICFSFESISKFQACEKMTGLAGLVEFI